LKTIDAKGPPTAGLREHRAFTTAEPMAAPTVERKDRPTAAHRGSREFMTAALTAARMAELTAVATGERTAERNR
jgi:hypothetical protein